MIINNIKSRDIRLIVDIHAQAFPDHFLTKLGPLFLKQYYKDVNRSKLGILWGIFETDVLIGFCAATKRASNFNKKIVLQSPLMYFLFAINLIFTKPSYLYRLIVNLNKVSNIVNDDGNYAEILSIAVLPEIQGRGAGKSLLKKLEAELCHMKINKLSLTTDSINNNNALNFYIKSMDYKILYEFTTYPNRKMYRLIKEL